MTDAMLLAIPDYLELTDPELARAVTLAKRRGRQTAELIQAQALELDQPSLCHRIGNFDLYINHCVRVAAVGPEIINDWGMKNAMEACEDPRLAWFCVVYQRRMWRFLGNPNLPPTPISVLRRIQDQQFVKLTQAQYSYSMQISAIHQSGGSVKDPRHREVLQELYTQFMAHLDYAMLATMTLNVATEEWMNRCG